MAKASPPMAPRLARSPWHGSRCHDSFLAGFTLWVAILVKLWGSGLPFAAEPVTKSFTIRGKDGNVPVFSQGRLGTLPSSAAC